MRSIRAFLAGTMLLTGCFYSSANAAEGPASGALVKMAPAAALQCVKAYMVAGKGYYLASARKDKLVFVRGMQNPYSLQEQITSPTSIIYERVHVDVQRAGDTTRVATFYSVVVPPTSKFEKETIAVEYGNQDMRRSYKRSARLAAWINSRPNADACY